MSLNRSISKKQESSRKKYFCFIDYTKTSDSVDHHKQQ